MTKELLPGLGSGALQEGQRVMIEGTVRKVIGNGNLLIKPDHSFDFVVAKDACVALSLSSPTEPPQTEMARHSGRQEVLIAVAHVLNKKDLSTQRRVSGFVGGKEALEALLTELLRPTPQASSEIREKK